MKIMITGANGQLGFDCIRVLEASGFNDLLKTDINVLDITNKEDVFKYILVNRPDVIIHCAAFTAVDKCEENKDLAYSVNVEGTRNIVEAAKSINAKVVYVSTDYVFDGCGMKPHEISEQQNPINHYGKTKFLAEQIVLEYSKSFVVRTSWVFGINGNNFVKTMIKLSNDHNELAVVSDQVGSPTYSYDLACFIKDLIQTDRYGIYHATNEEYCSWAELARYIFARIKVNVTVNDIDSKTYELSRKYSAKRPLNSRLSKKCLDENGFKRFPNWEDAVDRYLKELGLL